MTKRITEKDLQEKLAMVNRQIDAVDIVLRPRYNYQALDIIDPDTGGTLENLRAGMTKRECHEFLTAFSYGAELAKREAR